jgi:hypothetical protein
MRGHESTSSPVDRKQPLAPTPNLMEIGSKAARLFEDICGELLQRSDVKGFNGVQKKIEGASKLPCSLAPTGSGRGT